MFLGCLCLEFPPTIITLDSVILYSLIISNLVKYSNTFSYAVISAPLFTFNIALKASDYAFHLAFFYPCIGLLSTFFCYYFYSNFAQSNTHFFFYFSFMQQLSMIFSYDSLFLHVKFLTLLLKYFLTYFYMFL